MGKRSLVKKTDVLSASEIGQYMYCSCAWQLQRCGYEPESPFLESGKQVHVALGNTIDGFEAKMLYSRWYALLGFVVLCVAFLLVLFGVIL
jgi:CRISPR/Cas system-associated exonuclease Cas4 (RecB family)